MDINFGIWSLIPPILAVALAFLTKNVILSLFVSLFSGCLILAYGNPWTALQTTFSDYLFVDMPPGTGDVPLTVFQSLPVDGIVIVTSPQELVQMIVKKAYNMAEMMHVPVLGLVENFSYLKCPDCGKEIKLFGESHIDDVAKELGIPVFGKLPLDPAFAEQADKGAFATMENAYLDAGVEKLKTL